MNSFYTFPGLLSYTKAFAKRQFRVLAFVGFGMLFSTFVKGQCPTPVHPDYDALIAFYNATGGANWTNNTGWADGAAGTDCDPCSGWYGVQCNGAGRVTCIDMDGTDDCANTSGATGNGLTGTLPDLNLPMLEELYLAENDITGSIQDFSNMSSLKNLVLDNNSFSSSIPDFSNLPVLEQFDCSHNNLTGSIQDFSSLPNLKFFYCSNNNLSGPIPEFASCPDLEEFSCAFNPLGGSLPTFSALNSLEQFYASDCNLTGEIEDYSGLPLDIFWCNNNNLSGCFPPNTCNVSDFNSDFNSQLPWEGDISTFCGGTPQFEAPCDDGNPGNGVDLINADCSCAPCNHPDFDALMAFYNATNGAGWDDNTGWVDGAAGTDCDPCSWYRVACDGVGRVISIALISNNLAGNIPTQIGDLSRLESLRLSNNQLTGSIPPELGNLSRLKNLLFHNNQLTNNIPPELGNLSDLVNFMLHENQLTGNIPPELGNLSSLEDHLWLYSNQLTGNIPPELGNLSNLGSLMLFDNQLTGNIPPELGNLNNLEHLGLHENQLTGNIPPELGNLSKLESLTLDENQLINNIPPELGNLNKLEHLRIDNNQLTGNIPPELGNSSNLDYLTLDENQLTGNIPPELGNLSKLESLTLSDNQLTGCFPIFICNLTYFNASNNPELPWQGDHTNFCNGDPQEGAPCDDGSGSGFIAADCSCGPCDHPDFAELINFYNATGGANWTDNTGWADGAAGTDCDPCNGWYGISCNGSGRISFMNLTGNNLAGNLPDINLPFLETMYLSANQLSGNIPVFSNLSNLKFLRLSNCIFSGSIPNFTGLSSLETLWLFDNNLSGNIPDFNNITQLKTFLSYNNGLSGSIPDFFNLPNLEELVLHNNSLSGSIPDFSNLPNLWRLSISENSFSGNIPDFSNLPLLQNLFLDENNLTGDIPDFSNLPVLTFFIINDNDLSGCYPVSVCNLANFDALNNPQLPWQGDHTNFCAGQSQITAPCDDDDPSTNPDEILTDCTCGQACPIYDAWITVNTNSICPSESVDLTFNFTDGTPPYDVDYTDGFNNFTLTGIPNGHIETVFPPSPNTYDFETTNAVDSETCPGVVGLTATVDVEDTEDPTADCVFDFPLELDLSGNASITVADIDNGSSDNCTASGSLQIDLDITDFDCNDIGFQSVTMTVDDGNGNSAFCIVTIEILDVDAPQSDFCPNDLVICEGETVNYSDPTFEDNCGGAGQFGTYDFGPLDGDQPIVGNYTVRYYFDDLGGNAQAECIFSVEVNAIPNESDPAVEFICDGGTLTLFAPPGYDYEWDDGSTFEDRDVFSDGTYFLTITENNCEQVLTYQVDPAPPISVSITGPNPSIVFVDETIVLSEDPPTSNAALYDWQIISGDGDVDISNNNDGTADITGLLPGIVEIEYYVVDDLGCEGIATYILEIPNCIDENLPVIVQVLGNRTVCVGDLVDVNGDVNLQNGDVVEGIWTHDGTGTLSSTTSNSTIYTPATNDGGQSVTFTYTAVDPDGSGPCTIDPNFHYDLDNITVSSPIDPPTIICNSTSNEITFSWSPVSGASSYDIFIDNVPQGNQTNTDFTVTGLNPGDEVLIQVDAIPTSNVCPNSSASLTCFAQNCPTITVDITPVPDICLTAGTQTIQLQATQNGGIGNGTFTWSGTGITSGNIFDPQIANIGANTITVVYEENGCTFSANTTISVYQTPTAVFSATSPVCVELPAILTYTGNASGTAQFAWNTDGGTPQMPGTIGPHNVTWSTPNTKTVTLTVTENGCASSTEIQSVTVETPTADLVITCSSTTSSVTFNWNAIAGVTEYVVSINGGTPINHTSTTFVQSGLNPGDNVEISVTAISTNSCPSAMAVENCIAQNCLSVALNITPVAPICREPNTQPVLLSANPTGGAGGGTLVWSGNGTSTDGTFDPNQANIGINTISLEYTEGNCTYTETTNIEVNETPNADFSVPASVCITDPAVLTYTGNASPAAIYTWNTNGGIPGNPTGQGTHQINWSTPRDKNITLTVEENGCISTQNVQVVRIEPELQVPVINCLPSLNDITFSWNPITGVNEYAVSINGGTAITQSATTFVESSLNPGDNVEISVTAMSTTGCPSVTASISCLAQNCPTVDLNIDPVLAICRVPNAADLLLSANPTGGSGIGTFVWSGAGITDPSGVFNSQAANLGSNTVTLEYTEGNCVYREGIDIVVNQTPTADFSAEATICITDNAQIQYIGNASNAADFDWDFQNGNILSGSNGGTHEISWNDAGIKEITLTVIENGCVSTTVNRQIIVEPELQIPVINCDPTQSNITFSWNPISGANEYLVSINNGTALPQTGTTFVENGLNPGDNIEISVTAISTNNCPSTTAVENCVAQNCPTVDLNIDPVSLICQEPNSADIQLSANPSGGAGSSSFVWSGDGVTDPSGIFNSQNANLGINVITLEYSEGNCVYRETMDIQVNQRPTSDFSAKAAICENETATIQYIGNAGASAVFNWVFSNGTINSGSNGGPFEIGWNDAGIKQIMLTVEENGCTSTLSEQTVEVISALEIPQVICTSTISFVTFDWLPIAGATEYLISINGGAPTAQTTTTFVENGLTAGDNVSIEVRANDPNSICGASEPGTADCRAQNCPPVDVIIDPVADICLTNLTTPMLLNANSSGGMGGGNFVWSGSGVDASGNFDPTAGAIGTNLISVEYSEGTCLYSASISFNVFETPTADFSTDSKICISETSIVRYLGSATISNANFDFDLVDGNFISGSIQDGQEAKWDSPGLKNLTLTVTENGCTSLPFSQTIEIDPELAQPIINCSSTSSSVTFSWNAVPGADDYTILINGINSGTQTDLSFTVSSLQPNESVNISVTANGSTSCGSSLPGEADCIAQDCPLIIVNITPVPNICLNSNTQPIQLEANQTGGSGGGIWVWNGKGTDAAGLFNPKDADLGTNTITCEYSEGNCSYRSTVDILIIEIPAASFTAASPICQTETSQITFIGTNSPQLNFNWSLDGGTNISGNTDSPIEVSWNSPGLKNIVLELEDRGCMSTGSGEVQVDPLLENISINCQNVTASSVGFAWNGDLNVTDYEIFITDNSGNFVSQGTQTSTDFEVSGLPQNTPTDVTIRVVARGNTVCGNTESEFTCQNSNCPTLSSFYNEKICLTDSILINGIWYGKNRPSGSETFILDNGCDSTVTIDLDFYDVSKTEITDNFCEGDDYELPSGEIVNDAGIYRDTLQSFMTGCDSFLTVILNEIRPDSIILEDDFYEFHPDSSGIWIFPSENDDLPKEWYMDFDQLEPEIGELEQFDSLIRFTLINDGYRGEAIFKYRICRYECPENCPEATITINLPGDCFSQAKENIPNSIRPTSEHIENRAFDPLQEFIDLQCIEADAEARMSVVNRLGEIIYSVNEYAPWDGRSPSGKVVPQATYYFVLEISHNEEKLFFRGPVNVIQ